MSSRPSSRIGSPIAAISFGILLCFSVYQTVLVLPPNVLALAQSSPKVILFVLFHLFLNFLFSVALYRLTLHPLAKYPGPWLAAITDWYNVYHCSTGNRHLEFYKIHQRYGKFVRFGPSRLSINSVRGLQEVYNVNANNQKSKYYESYKAFFKAPMSMITLDRKKHAFKRRVVSRALSNALESEDLILRNVRIFCDILCEKEQNDGWSPARDMSKLIGCLTSDIMGDMTFSKNWNMLQSEENRYILDLLPQGVRGINMSGYMPALLKLKIDRLLFPKLVKDVLRFEALAKSQSDWRVSQKDLKIRDLFAGILDAKDPETGKGFSHEEIISEAGLLIIAGSDTSAGGICSTIFYLLHYPSTLLRLQTEIRDSFQSLEDIRAGAKLSSCTFLFACLNEALRLTPSVGAILPRTTLDGGIIADGEYFPTGVDLGVPIYCLQHNEEYYPEPFKFKPTRWLQEDNTTEELARTNSAFCAFGLGRASCVGKTIAYQEMSIVLARMIWDFDMRLKPGPDSTLGEGNAKLGYGRKLKEEFQVYEHFTSSHKGPLVEFKRVVHG